MLDWDDFDFHESDEEEEQIRQKRLRQAVFGFLLDRGEVLA